MTEPSRLPPRRALSAPTAERIRTQVLTDVTEPAPTPRRWAPLAAAAAVVALVAGAVLITERQPETSPAAPGATTIPAESIPTPSQVVERCGVGPTYRYTTRYQGDNAVTWLFVANKEKSTVVCTWKAGSTGIMANFINDWFDDGMAPARDGQVHVTQDLMMPGVEDGATLSPEYAQLERDRQVLVGPVPADVTKVVIDGPDGQQVAALGSHWFLYHLHKAGTYEVTAYDAAGDVVDTEQISAG
jgi:hypothetical protein